MYGFLVAGELALVFFASSPVFFSVIRRSQQGVRRNGDFLNTEYHKCGAVVVGIYDDGQKLLSRLRPQSAEETSDAFREKFRLLGGGEVAPLRHFSPALKVMSPFDTGKGIVPHLAWQSDQEEAFPANRFGACAFEARLLLTLRCV